MSLVHRTDYLSRAIAVTTTKSFSLIPYSTSAKVLIRFGTCKRETIYQVNFNAPEGYHYRGLIEVQHAIACRMPFSQELSESQGKELERCTEILKGEVIPEMIGILEPYRNKNYETIMLVASLEFKKGAMIRHTVAKEVDDPAWGRIFSGISESEMSF